MNKETQKMGFFKKVWYSIDKIEKYGELAAEGFPRAISYLFQIIIILAIVGASAASYQTKIVIDNIIQFMQNEIPDFTYTNNELKFETDEVIKKEQEFFGKVIIDTNQNGEKIDEYINEIPEGSNGVIVLKNKIVLKLAGIDGIITYNYEDLVKSLGVSEFKKEDIINYVNSTQMMSIYLSIFSLLLMSAITTYFINVILIVAIVSIFGYLATLITKMKMRYIAILNMAIYSITLPTILNIIYIIINQAFGIQIKYFDVMYILVSCIYMIAAIFILKSDFTKKQEQLSKVIEVKKQVEDEIRQEKENKKEDKNTNEKQPKEKDDKDEKNNGGEEPEGSNA